MACAKIVQTREKGAGGRHVTLFGAHHYALNVIFISVKEKPEVFSFFTSDRNTLISSGEESVGLGLRAADSDTISAHCTFSTIQPDQLHHPREERKKDP